MNAVVSTATAISGRGRDPPDRTTKTPSAAAQQELRQAPHDSAANSLTLFRILLVPVLVAAPWVFAYLTGGLQTVLRSQAAVPTGHAAAIADAHVGQRIRR